MSIVSLFSRSAFDPEIADTLAAAFDLAWERVCNSGSPLATGVTAETTRDTLARAIIDLAQRGERDTNRLIEGALSQLTANLVVPRRLTPDDRSAI